MNPVEVALVLGALAFALVTGANNGGTLVAVQLRGAVNPPWVPIVVLSVAVGVGPMLLGTRVAETITDHVAVFDASSHDFALATTLVVSVGLAAVLSARGLPTSLFAALIGALAGVGLGLGLAVDWPMVSLVFLAALLTPWIGAGIAWAMTRSRRLLPPVSPVRQWLRRRQLGSFFVLCVAYGANGAQVMVALLALSLQRSPVSVADSPGLLGLLAFCFAVGTVLGLSRLASSIGSGIIALRPPQVGTAKLASTIAVGGAGVVGLPVSTTQALTASLLGCGAADGYRRIRWHHAQRIAVAWLVTVPVAFALAAVIGAIGGVVL